MVMWMLSYNVIRNRKAEKLPGPDPGVTSLAGDHYD